MGSARGLSGRAGRGRPRRLPRRLRGGRLRRELTALEADLTAHTPALAALYQTFGQLTEGDYPAAGAPAGAEPLPPPLWRRPRFAGAATLAVLAAMVALCAVLSLQLRPAANCLAAASGPAAATTVAAAQVRAMDCAEYPASK
jgi:ferric-dicitrate binding protein FerR (iron transport regulator)